MLSKEKTTVIPRYYIFAATPWPDGTVKFMPVFEHIGSWQGYSRVHCITYYAGYLLSTDEETIHAISAQVANIESLLWDRVIHSCESGTATLGYSGAPITLPSDPVLMLYITVAMEYGSWKEFWELKRKENPR